jgi:hypothetical protein
VTRADIQRALHRWDSELSPQTSGASAPKRQRQMESSALCRTRTHRPPFTRTHPAADRRTSPSYT